MRRRDAPKELAEREGKPIAIGWIDAALRELSVYETWLAEGGPEPRGRSLVRSALATNFSHGDNSKSEEDEKTKNETSEVIAQIRRTFIHSRAVLVRSRRFFVAVSERNAKRVFRTVTTGQDIPPAYAIFKKAIYFTPRFEPHDASTGRGFGPLCRAAMVLHESIHVIDPQSGVANIHISEWDEPRFSAQTTLESLHNPSSYASFAAQVHAGAIDWPRSVRFGAGRPAD